MAEPIIVVKENSMTVQFVFPGEPQPKPEVIPDDGGRRTTWTVRFTEADYRHGRWVVEDKASEAVFHYLRDPTPYLAESGETA